MIYKMYIFYKKNIKYKKNIQKKILDRQRFILFLHIFIHNEKV